MHEFTQGDAMRLITKMRSCYGKKFTDQWVGVDPADMAESMVECYAGLTPQDFKRGLQRMYQSTFCPTVPEFRSWCIQGAEWLTEYEAWAQALAYTASSDTAQVSNFALAALKELRQSFNEINSKSETQAKAFRDIYNRITTKARSTGEQQVIIAAVDIKTLAAPDEAKRKVVRCPPELMSQLKQLGKMQKGGAV